MPAKKKRKPASSSTNREEIRVEGKKVVAKIKALIQEGNVRQIVVKNHKGKVIFTLPVTVGVVGAVILPPLAILGLVVAVSTSCTLTVVRSR